MENVYIVNAVRKIFVSDTVLMNKSQETFKA